MGSSDSNDAPVTLVDRMMWAIHVGLDTTGSPRREWAEMSDEARARLRTAAEGAIDVYEIYGGV